MLFSDSHELLHILFGSAADSCYLNHCLWTGLLDELLCEGFIHSQQFITDPCCDNDVRV